MEVIAEIGKNFVVTKEEQPLLMLLENAKELILAAKQSGAKICKFQVHTVEDEIHPDAKIISPHFSVDRYEWVKRNTYPVEFWYEIKEFCRKNDIEFLATPMSKGAAILLDEIGVDRWKIGSADILDFVMLDYIRDSGKPVILSTGMSSFQEIQKSYEFLTDCERVRDITILHCVSQYPCPISDLNLKTILFLRKKFPKAHIGFSDHSIGIEGSLMAASLGISMIEKHFTLDINSWGPDHKASITPNEMNELIKRLNNKEYIEPTEEALGIETKFISEGEMKFRPIFRKGLYASRDIQKGEFIEPDMIWALRPSGKTHSEEYPRFLGGFAEKNYTQYEVLL